MNKRRSATGLSILILLQSILLTGCWDSKEVEKLAVVTVVGIDYAQENGRDIWTASARILNPSPKRTEEAQSAATVDQDRLMVGKGRTQQEAMLDYSAHTSRIPFYGQVSTYIIGERAAREKMPDIIENVMRFWQTRPKNLIIVTKGEALQVLKTGSSGGRMLSTKLKDLGEYKAAATGYSYGTIMSDVTEWLLSPDRDAVATLVDAVPSKITGFDKQNLMEGLAVFRAGKLVGWLNREETKGYLLIAQKINRGQMSIPVEKDEKLFSYYLSSSKSNIEPIVTGNKISYLVTIKTQGEVDDSAGIELDPENITLIEKSIGDRLRELAMLAVNKAKEYDSDYLGFSEKLHRSNLTEWETIAPQWRDVFRDSDIQIKVDAKVIRTGKIGKKLNI